MSEYWYMNCLNCQVSAGGINRGDDFLQKVFLLRKELLACSEILNHNSEIFDSFPHLGECLFNFLRHHHDHDLCLMNEYGKKRSFITPVKLKRRPREFRQLQKKGSYIKQICEIDPPMLHQVIIKSFDKAMPNSSVIEDEIEFKYERTENVLLHIYKEE